MMEVQTMTPDQRTSAPDTLASVIHVPKRFHRSVNLTHDWQNSAALRDYVVTPTAFQLAARMASEITGSTGVRSWTITGPFGSGKSAFAGFLLDILSSTKPVHSQAKKIRRRANLDNATWHPVVITGRRAPVTALLLERLAATFDDALDGELAARLHEYTTANHRDIDVASVVREVVETRAHTTGQGTIIILDEFGKLLEYAALHPTDDDIFVLQELAEFAARSNGRFVLATIQHASFAAYAESGNLASANEWQKIQGRFTDVAFHLPIEQMLQLLNVSLDRKWDSPTSEKYAQFAEQHLNSPIFDVARSRITDFARLLANCLPIHPVTTLLLWPVFRSKLAQNERSLFAFLTSHEPYGFQEFLRSISLQDVSPSGIPPLFRPDYLYDYVAGSLGLGALLGDHAHHWAVADDTLNRLPSDAPELAAPLIKTIFLLSMFSPQAGIAASPETLQATFAGQDEDRREDVRNALQFLSTRSFVTFRRHRNAYALWEGSDLDIDRSYHLALRQLEIDSIGSLLNQISALAPRVARGHYLRTGYLRHFDVTTVEGAPAELSSLIASNIAQSSADGVIVFALAPPHRTPDYRAKFLQAARQASLDVVRNHSESVHSTHRPVIIAVPKMLPGIIEAMQSVLAWRHVRDTEPALASDHVARTEVGVRLTDAEDRLNQLLGAVLGLSGHPLDPTQSEWLISGQQIEFQNLREFQSYLSTLCDEAYLQAPPLSNELINRRQLSASAAKARRNLLDAMLHASDQPRLGITGAPPEAAMYDGVLAASGIHRMRNGVLGFGEPNATWQPLWSTFASILSEHGDHTCEVVELSTRLARPPFGLRSGPFPVILTAFLLAHEHDVALYENGTFVPELRIETIERLQRRPETFSLRWLHRDAARVRILQAIGTHFPTSHDQPDLIEIVRTFVVQVAKLTPFARQTRQFVEPQDMRVRQTLLKASDPYELLFTELPRALGIHNLNEPGQDTVYAERLAQSMTRLEDCYEAMIRQLRQTILTAFGLQSDGPAEELRRRARVILHLGTEQRLALFVREAARETSNWTEGLARAILDGVPPTQWNDRDVATFHARIQLIAHEFLRLEELVRDQVAHGGHPLIRVDILNGHHNQVRVPLATTPQLERAVTGLLERISTAFAAPNGQHDVPESIARQARIGALAQALAREINEMPTEDEAVSTRIQPEEMF